MSKAVMVSVESRGDKLRVVFDDLIQDTGALYRKEVLYTFKEYDLKSFEELEFDEQDVKDLGYALLARLHAFYEFEKQKNLVNR